MSKKKGSTYERKLSNRVAEEDWFVQRVHSSGSGTSRELPDLLMAKDGRIVVVELKYVSSANMIYAKSEKVRGLCWLADMLNAEPRLVARFAQDTTFYARHPDDCSRTDAGMYTIHKNDRDMCDSVPAEL